MINRPTTMQRLSTAIGRSPITAILGPRQCGKTTLARWFGSGRKAEPRKRAHSSPLAAGLASELEIDFHPYGEDSPRLAAGRVQSLLGALINMDSIGGVGSLKGKTLGYKKEIWFLDRNLGI